MSNGFIKGALIGGVIAGVTGLLLAPKAGNKLIEDILDIYHSAEENGHDFIEALREKGSDLSDSLRETGAYVSNTIKSKGACLKGFCSGEEESDTTHSSLVMGLVIGALVAGVTSLLLAPESGKKMRKILGNQYDDVREKAADFVSSVDGRREKLMNGACEWKDSLTDLVNKLSTSHSTNKKGSGYSSQLNNVMELASIGLNLYQQLKRRR